MSEEQLIKTPGVFGEGGTFILERELGRGGMGSVYMGRDKMLDRPIALKAMLREYGNDPEFVDRFKKEAQAAAKLIHPNIAQIYSYGFYDGIPYIVMELVAGGSLDQIMNASGANTDIPRVMKICEQIAQALRCSSDQGLVHGDVKPENILLDANGNAKLMDFGLVAMQKDTSEIWGTPYYIAPEKVRKQPIDYRADMYSLGGTLYHAICGEPPFEGEDANIVVRKRFEAPPRKPSEVRPGISPQIDFLVMKMLAVDPQDRYPSFEALLADFKKVMATGLKVTSRVTSATARITSRITGRLTEVGEEMPESTSSKKFVIHGRKKFNIKKDGEESEKGSDEKGEVDEEENDNVGKKVALFIGAIVATVLVIAGGLIWYVNADKKERETERQKQINKGFEAAKKSLELTRDATKKLTEDFRNYTDETWDECEKVTKNLQLAMSADYSKSLIAGLKPQMTQKLLSAIASTNANNAVAKKETAVVVDDKDGKKTEPPSFYRSLHEMWEKTYNLRAVEITVYSKTKDIISKIDSSLNVKNKDEDAMQAMAKSANDLKAEYDETKALLLTKDAKDVRSFVVSRGKSILNDNARRIREEAAQKARAEAKKKAEEAEKARLADKASAKAKKIEEETLAARECYNKLVSDGKIRQLDWKGCYRVIDALSLETAEAQIERDKQRNKIECMELMQNIFIRQLKGYTFTRGAKDKNVNLRGAKVVDVDAKELTVQAKGSQKKEKILWQTFYARYNNSLDEIMTRYIIKSGTIREVERLSKLKRFEAMIGAAFVLRIVCAENPSAMAYGEKLVKDAAKDFPEKFKVVKEYFSDIDFTDIEAAVQADAI